MKRSRRRPSTLGILRGQVFVLIDIYFIVAVYGCLGFISIVEVEYILSLCRQFYRQICYCRQDMPIRYIKKVKSSHDSINNVRSPRQKNHKNQQFSSIKWVILGICLR